MNVVDSSGWLEYFADGPNADFFAGAIEADSIILATAHRQDATLWTQDEHFEHINGVQYIAKRG